MTNWRSAGRKAKNYLRSSWFPEGLKSIRSSANDLSPSRRHVVIHAFNNLLASKVNMINHYLADINLSWIN